jgi:type IV pilus assembly protein PilE
MARGIGKMNSRLRRHSTRSGFTLIELMITVAIVSILAAVALPSFQEQVRRSQRAEGKTALLRAAQFLERNYTVTNAYVTDLAPLHGLAPNAVVYSGENPALAAGNYRITASNQPCGNAQCYTLTATRNGGFTDPRCGDLTLTSTGVRGRVNGTDTVDQCWLR